MSVWLSVDGQVTCGRLGGGCTDLWHLLSLCVRLEFSILKRLEKMKDHDEH